jgi:hypothetical protein
VYIIAIVVVFFLVLMFVFMKLEKYGVMSRGNFLENNIEIDGGKMLSKKIENKYNNIFFQKKKIFNKNFFKY